jgi:hypothetical protein
MEQALKTFLGRSRLLTNDLFPTGPTALLRTEIPKAGIVTGDTPEFLLTALHVPLQK